MPIGIQLHFVFVPAAPILVNLPISEPCIL